MLQALLGASLCRALCGTRLWLRVVNWKDRAVLEFYDWEAYFLFARAWLFRLVVYALLVVYIEGAFVAW